MFNKNDISQARVSSETNRQSATDTTAPPKQICDKPLLDLLDALPGAIVLFDQCHHCRFVNRAFTRIFKWNRDEVDGAGVDFIPSGDMDAFFSAPGDNETEAPQPQLETTCRDKTGQRHTLRYSLHPFTRTAGGNSLCMAVIEHRPAEGQASTEVSQAQNELARQIHEGRRAQKINRILFSISNAVNTTENLNALYASIHEHLSTIIDLANFFIALHHKESNTITFPYFVDKVDTEYEHSVNFLETNSLTAEVIISGRPALLSEKDIRTRVVEKRILGTPPRIWIGVPLKVRDSVIGIMSTQSYTDPDHFDQIDLDILTAVSDQIAIAIERKRAQEASRESEAKYRTILASIEDGYYEVDMRGQLTFFNEALCGILGYAHKELAELNVKTLMNDDNAAILTRAFDDVLKTGRAIKARSCRLRRKDGSDCFLELGISLISGTDGRPMGFRGIARDVTERIQSEQQRQRLEQRLQQSQRLESLGKLAGGIAHDFNNLMMGIQGRTSMIMAGTAANHPHFGQLQGIEDCVKSATNLTKRLLGFARGGKYDVKPTNLNHLVRKSVDMFGRTKKEVAMTTEFQKNLWATEVDTNQIEQVLLNLFVNAWQAMPGGGRIGIRTENIALAEKEARHLAAKPGNYICLSVTDTGMGMDQKTIHKIFDPFFTTKSMGGGTGLGLASVYGIVKNHHGAISVYSEVGKGSTFRIYLPATDKVAQKEKTAVEGDLKKGTETILLVDDEELILDVGRQVLQMLGYRVITASSGKEAVQIYKKEKNTIDLSVIDMIMPEMNGGELYDRLKEADSNIKVILSSGYSMNDQALEILKKGCNGFIQKPFNMAQISEKIREVIDS